MFLKFWMENPTTLDVAFLSLPGSRQVHAERSLTKTKINVAKCMARGDLRASCPCDFVGFLLLTIHRILNVRSNCVCGKPTGGNVETDKEKKIGLSWYFHYKYLKLALNGEDQKKVPLIDLIAFVFKTVVFLTRRSVSESSVQFLASQA